MVNHDPFGPFSVFAADARGLSLPDIVLILYPFHKESYMIQSMKEVKMLILSVFPLPLHLQLFFSYSEKCNRCLTTSGSCRSAIDDGIG